jgi:hypothetical protein
VQRQLSVLGVESLGLHLRRSSCSLASFLGKEVAPKATEVSEWVCRSLILCGASRERLVPLSQRGMSRSDRGIMLGLRRSRWTGALNSQISTLSLKTPSPSIIREIFRLFVAVAILIDEDIWHAHTRGEASHGILSRLRLLTNPVRLPPLEMQQSCRGLLSRAQVDRPVDKRKAS